MTSTCTLRRATIAGLSALLIVVVGFAQMRADDVKKPAKAHEPIDAERLATQQGQVAAKYQELRDVLIRMSEVMAITDPRRAALLRKAVNQSNELAIDVQFEKLLVLLKQDSLARAIKDQETVEGDLTRLLNLLLSEDRTRRIKSEKERIREYLKRVNTIIKEQKSLQGETPNAPDVRRLAQDQQGLAKKTGVLAKDIKSTDGSEKPAGGAEAGQPPPSPQDEKKPADDQRPQDKPQKEDPQKAADKTAKGAEGADKKSSSKGSDEKKDKSKGGQDGKPSKSQQKPSGQGGQPGADQQPEEQKPSDERSPAARRVEQAQRKMEAARRKLDEAKRQDAADEQELAVRELEQAKAELEEILRQLREEEIGRTLALLESRFRKMLEMETTVYEGTQAVEKRLSPQDSRDDEIEAGRLSRKQAEIASEADRALTLMREEGSAVAMAEAVLAIREDMQQVVGMLGANNVGSLTQSIEKDIIVSLEEMIAALKKAQKDKDKSKPKPPGGSGGGSPPEPPLVDAIAEIKMIRALQMRVNKRTQRYTEIVKSEQAEQPEILAALGQLSERQQRIYRVTRDIALGRNR